MVTKARTSLISFVAEFEKEEISRTIMGHFHRTTIIIPLEQRDNELVPSFVQSIRTQDEEVDLTTLNPCRYYAVINANHREGYEHVVCPDYYFPDIDFFAEDLPKLMVQTFTNPKFRRLPTICIAYMLSMYQRKFKAKEYLPKRSKAVGEGDIARIKVPNFKDVRLLVDLILFLDVPPHIHDNACSAIAMHNPFWSLCKHEGILMSYFREYKLLTDEDEKVELREKVRNHIKLGVASHE